MSVHIYKNNPNPNSKKVSKLLVQGTDMFILYTYVFTNLPLIYKTMMSRVLNSSFNNVNIVRTRSRFTSSKKRMFSCAQCGKAKTKSKMKVHMLTEHSTRAKRVKNNRAKGKGSESVGMETNVPLTYEVQTTDVRKVEERILTDVREPENTSPISIVTEDLRSKISVVNTDPKEPPKELLQDNPSANKKIKLIPMNLKSMKKKEKNQTNKEHQNKY